MSYRESNFSIPTLVSFCKKVRVKYQCAFVYVTLLNKKVPLFMDVCVIIFLFVPFRVNQVF
jgi:hypothetical protein